MSHAERTPWRIRRRRPFPLRCVARYDDPQNRWRSRWGEPRVVSAGVWPGSAAKKQPASVRLTSALCREAWAEPKWEGAAPEVVWVAEAPTLVAAVVADGSGKVEVAADVATQLGLSWSQGTVKGPEIAHRGLVVLLGLAGLFLRRALNYDDDQAALSAVLDGWDVLPAHDRYAALTLLESPQIDSGHIFGDFVRVIGDEVRRKEANETIQEWRRRWITWLLGQARVDLPYDRAKSEEILRADMDPDEARLALHRTASEYDRTTEQENARRVSRQVAWAEEELIFGRMSRAFHNQGLLFAHARVITITDPVARAADALVNAASRWDKLRPAADRICLLVQPGRETPLTELAGALDHLEEEALRHQRALAQVALQRRRSQVETAASDPEADRRAEEDLHELMSAGQAILGASGSLRQEMLKAPRRPAAYVVMSQRLFPTETHILVKINRGDEPYPGKLENLRRLASLARDRIYASPDYVWLQYADHWVEAIPLFIKERIRVVEGVETAETVIDQEGMEESFRELMADHWVVNLRLTELSGYCALARAFVVDDHGEVADLSREADFPRAWQVLRTGRPAEVADLAAVIALAAGSKAYEIGLIYESELASTSGADRLNATRTVLLGSGSVYPLWDAVRAVHLAGAAWADAAARAISETSEDTTAEVARIREELTPLVDVPRRALPALHVLTTQSARMTDGYIRSWLEESMALANVVRAHDLDDAVRNRMERYTDEIVALGERLVEELGLGAEVDATMAGEGVGRAWAVRRVVGANRLVQQQASFLAVLREAARHLGYGGSSEGAGNILDPPQVDQYIERFGDELEALALADVIGRNEHDIAASVEKLRIEDPAANDADLRCRVVQSNPDYRADLKTFIRFAARERLLGEWDKEHRELKLRERCDTWLRHHQRLALTTARKEILAEQGLNHLTLDPRYYYQATGGAKRYHLLYTPSRVDLGPRERESVETWSQWVGGRDRQAAQVGRRLYSLINKAVKRFESLTEPEVLKTGENASMASHFAYSNAMALMVNATGRGDIEDLGDQMSLREDRKIHPAGEGYGGYCVPKDGLFLEFVLTLTEQVKLRQLGIPERYHRQVAQLARRVLHEREAFAAELEWEAWAEKQLADVEAMKEVFSLRSVRRSDGDEQEVPVFQITRLARVLDELGQPPLGEHRSVVKALAARWGIHTMIAGAEHVNRFMPFYKVWLTYDALAHAQRSSARIASPEKAVIVLTAEYKPDTQDGRFAVGMRKYELYVGIGDHLRYSLGAEAAALAALMLDGWDKTVAVRGHDDPGLQSVAAQWGLDIRTSDEARERMRGTFPGYPSPAEVRLVSPMGLSTQDVLRYTSDTRIEHVADEVRAELWAAGLSDDDIRANFSTFGPHIASWAKLRGKPGTGELVRRIGGTVHALALAVLGPDRSYEHALEGSDVFDVGIPHRPVRELLDEPARLRDLMLYGRPRSALIIVDGASGARRRALSRLGVMRWFAAAEQVGKMSHYRSIGLGEETIEDWRRLMRQQKARAESLRARWCSGDAASAEAAFRQVVELVRDGQEALLALEEEERLMRFERDVERDHVVAELLADLARMDSPRSFTFAHWLALGGMFCVDGMPEEAIASADREFREASARLFGTRASGRSREREWELVRKLVTPGRMLSGATFRQEGSIQSSNKATEEVAKIALDTRRQLAERARRMLDLRERSTAFDRTLHEARQRSTPADELVAAIRTILAEPESFVSNDAFGRALALIRLLGERLVADLCPMGSEQANEIGERLRSLLTGRQFDPDTVRSVCGGYEDIGAIGTLAQLAVERAGSEGWSDERRCEALELVAVLAEFVDTAHALDVTLSDRQGPADHVDAPALWRRLAAFFAETINDHFYEHRPWAYSHGVGFDEFQGDGLYRLANRHYAWLYAYLRALIATKTEVRHLSAVEQDLLLGRLTDDEVIVAIGAAGATEQERRWRAYNQLRDIAFLRNDGFPLPPVFNGFDPALIDGDNRVNILCMYPIGRTHVSRLLAEGPTLARELVTDGQRAANIILTRLPTLDEPYVRIEEGHFYVDRDTYTAALRRYWGLSDPGAEALARRDVGPKGIRIAARFSRPIVAGIVLPMHGNPLYDEGHLERLGLPYSVQSRFHTWTTYDKTKYPDIFTPDTGVLIPTEIDWLHEWTAETDEQSARSQVRNGKPGTSYTGLESFSEAHRVVMLKDAAESGGRNQKSFVLRGVTGAVDADEMGRAVEFLYQVSLHHNVSVQEVIVSTPEAWATEEFLERFTDRQIIEWHRPIRRDRRPQTPLFGSHRLILSTDRPRAKDRVRHWHISHRITLNSTQLITNIGRGGTLELLRPADIRAEHREAITSVLNEAGCRVMEAMAAYENKTAKHYRDETGHGVGNDLTGVSYGIPRYLMLDFLLRPTFRRSGEVVDIVPELDDSGQRTGSTLILQDGQETFVGEISGWNAILIEPNIGIGLWDRVALREEEYERHRAESAGEPMDWDRVGENARVVLRDFARAGTEYLAALKKHAND